MHPVSLTPEQLSRPVPAGHKRVKILKHMGPWSPNDIVDMPDETADAVCRVSNVHNGTELVPLQRGILWADAEELAKVPIDPNDPDLTQADMAAMGKKNVVQTPPDPKLDAQLKRAQEKAAKDRAPKPKTA